MVEYQESSLKFLSIGDAIGSLNSAVEAGDEQFYEEIEAPKFVDFTAPYHYCPDDRYWFCLRVGCDQKHEEEMDSETIYKNFVLRVMAARSPNIRLRKALDRNATRSPSNCPLSAPPKRSKPRLSNMAIISSFSKKTDDGKRGVVRSLLKPKPTTPVLKMKTKPVAAKYLTTPRNRAAPSNKSSFRSVQNPKLEKIEVPKGRVTAKALVFHSPRKAIKIKTSAELHTPILKICEGVNKLEISSQRKRTMGYSSKLSKNLSNTSSTRQLSSCKVQGRPQGSSLSSQICPHQEAKSGRPVHCKVKEKLEKQCLAPKKLMGDDHMSSSKKNESNGTKKQLPEQVEEEGEVKETTSEGTCISFEVARSTMNLDSVLLDVVKGEENCEYLEGNEKLTSQATEGPEMSNNSRNGKGSSGNCGEVMNHLNISNSSDKQKQEHRFMDGDNKENAAGSKDRANTRISSKEERQGHEFMDGDDKENAAASDENRMRKKNTKPNGKKLFRMHDNCCQVKKKIAQAENKSLREGLIPSSPTCKLKKLKPTNLKPFRLRTDERGILKEGNLEKRADPPPSQTETANLSTPNRKSQSKQGNSIQKKIMSIDQKVVPKVGHQKSKAAAAPMTPEINKHQGSKMMSSPLERLEKFRKMKSPIQKHAVRPQGPLSSTKKELTSFLIPGQKLDVIHEISPEVRKAGQPTGNHSSSCGKQSARELKFHSKHVLKCCTKSHSR